MEKDKLKSTQKRESCGYILWKDNEAWSAKTEQGGS